MRKNTRGNKEIDHTSGTSENITMLKERQMTHSINGATKSCTEVQSNNTFKGNRQQLQVNQQPQNATKDLNTTTNSLNLAIQSKQSGKEQQRGSVIYPNDPSKHSKTNGVVKTIGVPNAGLVKDINNSKLDREFVKEEDNKNVNLV